MISKLKNGFLNLLVVLVLIVFLFPIVWMILTSIKSPEATFAIPPVWFFKPTMANFKKAYDLMPLDKYFVNTIIIAFSTATFCVFLGISGAYAISRFRFKGKRLFQGWVYGTQMIPPIVVVIPLFMMFLRAGLIGTFQAQILANTAFLLPFATWMLVGFISDLPPELEEAAMVDGTTRLGALFRITLPLAAPGVGAVWVLTLIYSWNSFLVPLALANEATKPLAMAIAGFKTDKGIFWGPAAAGGISTILPVLVMAIFVQRYIVKGLTGGAVKG